MIWTIFTKDTTFSFFFLFFISMHISIISTVSSPGKCIRKHVTEDKAISYLSPYADAHQACFLLSARTCLCVPEKCKFSGPWSKPWPPSVPLQWWSACRPNVFSSSLVPPIIQCERWRVRSISSRLVIYWCFSGMTKYTFALSPWDRNPRLCAKTWVFS